MGDLTKIKLRLLLDRKKLTAKHIEILKILYDSKDKHLMNTPDHPFFKCDRWLMIQPTDIDCLHYSGMDYGEHIVFSCEFKNYDNELEKFCDWIFPVCKHEDHEFLGIYYNDHNDWMKPIYYK